MSNLNIQHENWVDTNLLEGVKETWVHGILTTDDANGSIFGVRIFRGEEPISLLGIHVFGSVILPDGQTIGNISGFEEENKAWIILPESACQFPGELLISIRIEIPDVFRATVGLMHATVQKAQ